MIKLSCNSATFPKMPIRQALEKYARMGITRLELIQFMHGEEVLNAAAKDLAKLAEEFGQQIIAVYPRPIDPWSEQKFATSIDGVKRAMDIADELGARRIVFPPLLPREKFDYGKLAEGCELLLKHLGKRDMFICLENHHGWPMDLAEDYRKVFAAVTDRRLGMAFDTGHFTASNVDMPALIREFAPRIHHVHLKDHIGTQSVGFGHGQTDNVGVMQRLREAGYDGYASIELEVKDEENLERHLREAVEYCRGRLGLV